MDTEQATRSSSGYDYRRVDEGVSCLRRAKAEGEAHSTYARCMMARGCWWWCCCCALLLEVGKAALVYWYQR